MAGVPVPVMQRASQLALIPAETVRLSFGCGVIDEAFGGGLPLHGIHEICGEAGSGKTQLCLQLAIQAALTGGKCCYLTSGEGQFPVKRLEQLAEAASRRSGGALTKNQLMEGVLIQACSSVEALMEVIDNELARVMGSSDVRLVVIDSVAGAFRSDDRIDSSSVAKAPSSNGGNGGTAGRSSGQNRARDLFLFAANLRRLSLVHHAPVVVVNQATSLFESDASKPEHAHVHADMRATFPDLRVKPALGLSWATCVNQRIMLQRRAAVLAAGAPKGLDSSSDGTSCSWRRDAVLMLSPCSPLGVVEFGILPNGVEGIVHSFDYE